MERGVVRREKKMKFDHLKQKASKLNFAHESSLENESGQASVNKSITCLRRKSVTEAKLKVIEENRQFGVAKGKFVNS